MSYRLLNFNSFKFILYVCLVVTELHSTQYSSNLPVAVFCGFIRSLKLSSSFRGGAAKTFLPLSVLSEHRGW